MRITINGREFEWDDEKAKANKKKHGVSFKMAARVFEDEDLIERYDEEHSWDEDQWQVIGMVDDVLFVVYTMRTDTTRLISARKANNEEKEEYFGDS